ncbi:MAG: hypothetical protein ABIG11_03925 [bacterium]
MHNRIKILEDLVSETASRIKKLEEENVILRRQVDSLSSEAKRMYEGMKRLRQLEDWKARLKNRLQKLCSRIDKAIG